MAIDRAVNMATRVTGIGEVERDFRRIGAAGEAGFDKIGKAANDAGRELTEYERRIERAEAAAARAFDRMVQRDPNLIAARLDDPEKFNQGLGQARADFVANAGRIEGNAISEGLAETTAGYESLFAASEQASGGMLRGAAVAAAAGTALLVLKDFALASAEAFLEHEAAIDRFGAEMSLLGNRTTATGTQIKQFARDVAAAFAVTEDAALQGARELASVNDLTAASFEEALAASAAFAQAAGRELPDVLEEITIPVLQALADRDMKALFEATDGLNDNLRVTILRMAEAGDTAGAQIALFQGLARAAGDSDSSGLASASDRLSKAWERVKVEVGEDFAPAAAASLNFLTDTLDRTTSAVGRLNGGWLALARNSVLSAIPGPAGLFARGLTRLPPASQPQDLITEEGRADIQRLLQPNVSDELADFERRFGGNGRRASAAPRPRARADNSAEREAERLKREAERAREAADRIVIANDDIVTSYAQRVREATDTLGLEGDALADVERRHEIEAAVRRINTDLITKEVEARRAAAAAAKLPFDEATERAAATEAVNAQQQAVRGLAAELADVNEQQAEFNTRQAEAKTILELLETPMDAINRDLATASRLLRGGSLGADEFNAYMDLLAERLADVRSETDQTAQAWAGFGDQVSGTLIDFAVNGGNALDVLQRLVGFALERQLEQTLGNPLTDFIDGLSGNNREDNVAAARADLPQADAVLRSTIQLESSSLAAAAGLGAVEQTGFGAAQALAAVSGTAITEIDLLASESSAAASAMGGLIPITGQFGGALTQVLAQLASGGGGGGLGGLLGIAGSLLGAAFGGGSGPQASLAGSATDTILSNPSLFASGTDRLPMGRWFEVGENGRELMRLNPGGRMEVMGSARSRRFIGDGGGGVTIQQSFTIPERADPRRTASTISRATQGGIARSVRKGLAAGASR